MTDEPAPQPDEPEAPAREPPDGVGHPSPPLPKEPPPAPPEPPPGLQFQLQLGHGQDARAADPWAHRRGEPRLFAAGWLFFLFAASTLTIAAVGIFGLVSTDVYRPAARIMLEVIAVGIVLLWPMVRLSQIAPSRPLGSMFQDALIVLLPLQAVVWPQALVWMAGWPVDVVGAVSALLCGWGLLTAGLMAAYFAAYPAARAGPPRHPLVPPWAMMALIVLLVSVGPVIVALTPQVTPNPLPSTEWLMTSPLTAIFEITRDRNWTGKSAAIDFRHWSGIGLAWFAAALVWAAAAAIRSGRPAPDEAPTP